MTNKYDSADFEPYGVPEDVLPLWGVRLCKGLRADGSHVSVWYIDGEVSYTELLGALEVLKADLIQNYQAEEEEEEN